MHLLFSVVPPGKVPDGRDLMEAIGLIGLPPPVLAAFFSGFNANLKKVTSLVGLLSHLG